MKIKYYLLTVCSLFLFFSCETDSSSVEDMHSIDFKGTTVENNLNSENNKNQLEVFPIKIDVGLLKVPKRGSIDCSFGFGICVTISFRQSLPEIPSIGYNEATGMVKAYAQSTEKGKLELHFPSDIVKSRYHTTSDLNTFIVRENRKNGIFVFLKGEYPLEKKNGQYVYTIDVENNNEK